MQLDIEMVQVVSRLTESGIEHLILGPLATVYSPKLRQRNLGASIDGRLTSNSHSNAIIGNKRWLS